MVVKTVPNLYFGSLELGRLRDSIQSEGYRKLFKALTKIPGVVLNDNMLDSLLIVEGSSNNKVTIRPGLAVDVNLNVIEVTADNIKETIVPVDNLLMYVLIRYRPTSEEKGTVSVSSNGNVVGVGTQFLKAFRGIPLNPHKIRFLYSMLNQTDIEIKEVISDTSLVLSQSINIAPEVDQKYAVVGCFTPGEYIPSQNQLIYINDDYELLVTNVVDPGDVILARVTRLTNGPGSPTLLIEDLRIQNKYVATDTTATIIQQVTTQLTQQILQSNPLITPITAISSSFFLVGGQTVTTYKLFNKVSIQGSVTISTSPPFPFADVEIFTLPTGHAPVTVLRFPVQFYDSGSSFNYDFMATVNTDGTVTVTYTGTDPMDQGRLDISSISFYTV